MVRWNDGTEHVKTQRPGVDAIETWHGSTMSIAKSACRQEIKR
jgi:hypothetical protein